MAVQRRDVLDIMLAGKLVPVFNHDDADVAKMVIQSCYRAGLRVFEWTNRGNQALKLFDEMLAFTRSDCPGMKLGVGSIMDTETAEVFVSKGAEFLVSPVFDPEIAVYAREAEILYIPGCGSATEIHQAQKYGAQMVKIFPGNVLGPSFVQAILGPMPWTQMMPTGGVRPDRDNLEAWFQSGVVCVGMGSQLFKKEWLNEQGMQEMERLLAEVLEVIKPF